MIRHALAAVVGGLPASGLVASQLVDTATAPPSRSPIVGDPDGVPRLPVDVTQPDVYASEAIASTTVMASYHGVAPLAAT